MNDQETDVIQSFRVDADLRRAFQAACQSNDQTASQVFRTFMREYVKKHGQADLFKS